jgi:hypothetical protein
MNGVSPNGTASLTWFSPETNSVTSESKIIELPIKLMNRLSKMPTSPSIAHVATELQNFSRQLWGKNCVKIMSDLAMGDYCRTIP